MTLVKRLLKINRCFYVDRIPMASSLALELKKADSIYCKMSLEFLLATKQRHKCAKQILYLDCSLQSAQVCCQWVRFSIQTVKFQSDLVCASDCLITNQQKLTITFFDDDHFIFKQMFQKNRMD